jgi:hypothetical protein
MLTLKFACGRPPGGGRQVNQWTGDSGEIFARAFCRENLQWIDWLDVGLFAIEAGSNEVQVWPRFDVSHALVGEIFFRIRPLILQASGWQVLHAGAAMRQGGVLAFSGRSGSGKSTLAFAMQSAGWRQFADDALVVRPEGNRVMACPIPFNPQLRTASRVHFGQLHSPIIKVDPADAPLRAVYILDQNPDAIHPSISLLPQARAFSELLAHATCFNGETQQHTRRMVESYLALVACVPVFTLKYRPDFNELPELVRLVVRTAENVGVSSRRSSELRCYALQA